MQDDTLSQPLPLPRPRRTVRVAVLAALLAFVLGGVLVVWLVHSGRLPGALPSANDAPVPRLVVGQAPRAGSAAAALLPRSGDSLSSVETRLALLEDRLTRIDGEATAASGNAARAEALLIAYAARRRIDQGEPLGFIEDQLKLRFAGAQPKAVETIVTAARQPLTLDELSARLDALSPVLAGAPRDESTWTRVRREIASLFVVRRAPVSAVSPKDRVARARLMIAGGRIDEAIAEVERLPGADGAQSWIEAAHRYGDAQNALEVIETTAMLDSRGLRDAAGKAVAQPSPLAPSPTAADAAPGTPPGTPAIAPATQAPTA